MSSILPLPHGVVGEFVGRSHVDLGRVAELLGATRRSLMPRLIGTATATGKRLARAAAHSRPARYRRISAFQGRADRVKSFTAAFLGKVSASSDACLSPWETPGAASSRRPARHLAVRSRQEGRQYRDRSPISTTSSTQRRGPHMHACCGPRAGNASKSAKPKRRRGRLIVRIWRLACRTAFPRRFPC